MKSPREVLEKYFDAVSSKEGYNWKVVDKALSDLAEIVKGEKKEIKSCWGEDVTLSEAQDIYDSQLGERIYNNAINHIAKLFTDKEQQ